MKKIIVITIAVLLSVAAFAQNGRSIYNKYSDAEGVSAVYISPAMFRLMGKIPEMDMGGEDIDLSSIVKSLNGFYLIDSVNTTINDDLRRDVEKYISSGKFELLMEIKDAGEKVQILSMGDEKTVTSLVMMASEQNEFTFISMDGVMSREKLEDILANSMK